MNISIIGTGYVGLTTGAVLAEKGHKVLCVDKDLPKINRISNGKLPIYEPGLDKLVDKNVRTKRLSFGTTIQEAVQAAKVIFMCLPTPTLPGGQADLSFIEEVARHIAVNLKEYKLIVEKSTVPVKTGEKLKQVITKYAKKDVDFDIASNPEFLREGSAVEDALSPDRIVIGVENKRAEMIMRNIYKPFKAPILVTDIESAELIKHAANSFLALKISYANALSAICELVGADVKEVARGIGMDHRIGSAFLEAGVGYGGSCFPKDINAFYTIAKDLGYDFTLLREIEQINRHAKERFIKKVEQELWILKGKQIAVLGLSFKKNTDDVRNSVSIEIIKSLLEHDVKIKAYDPKAIPNAKKEVDTKKVTFCKNAYDACKGADCLLILTDWDEFKELDYEKIRKIMNLTTIIDGRNLLEPERMRKLGFTYRSMGRKI